MSNSPPVQLSPLPVQPQVPGAVESNLDALDALVGSAPPADGAEAAPLIAPGENDPRRSDRRRGSITQVFGKSEGADDSNKDSKTAFAARMKRATSKTAVFNMANLATMAAKAEGGGKSKEQADHENAGLEYWEYAGNKLDSRTVAASKIPAFLEETAKACNSAYEETQVRNEVEDVETGASDSKNASSCRWIHMRGVNFEALDELAKHFHLGREVMEECKAVASKPSVSWQQPTQDMRCARRW